VSQALWAAGRKPPSPARSPTLFPDPLLKATLDHVSETLLGSAELTEAWLTRSAFVTFEWEEARRHSEDTHFTYMCTYAYAYICAYVYMYM